MPKKRKMKEAMTFGVRLATLRKAAGYTQAELGEELDISQRMMAYYEGQTEHPPTTLLPALARALRVSTDELLGMTPPKKEIKPANTRLQRRIQEIEKLDARQKRQIMQFLDTFIEREKLKQRVNAQEA